MLKIDRLNKIDRWKSNERTIAMGQNLRRTNTHDQFEKNIWENWSHSKHFHYTSAQNLHTLWYRRTTYLWMTWCWGQLFPCHIFMIANNTRMCPRYVLYVLRLWYLIDINYERMIFCKYVKNSKLQLVKIYTIRVYSTKSQYALCLRKWRASRKPTSNNIQIYIQPTTPSRKPSRE